ncbi:MAG TPA: hypothetical protein VMW47_04640 [Verrucomicrobiae bacterium]|nr:hypothetical protein [Verrucomicrobiae bacterium]
MYSSDELTLSIRSPNMKRPSLSHPPPLTAAVEPTATAAATAASTGTRAVTTTQTSLQRRLGGPFIRLVLGALALAELVVAVGLVIEASSSSHEAGFVRFIDATSGPMLRLFAFVGAHPLPHGHLHIGGLIAMSVFLVGGILVCLVIRPLLASGRQQTQRVTVDVP